MDNKEAMRAAKEYVADLFAEEQISDVELEEIKFDYYSETWRVTVGFFRPRHEADRVKYPFHKDGSLARSYKVVCIADQSGAVQWVEDRILMDPFAVKEIESPGMDRAEAAQMAKECIISLFDDENIRDIGFEELKFDSDSRIWAITVGFAHEWQYGGSQKYPFDDAGNFSRSYKTVHIHDETRRIKEIKDRFLVDSFLVNRQ